jgi:hypothetical protein
MFRTEGMQEQPSPCLEQATEIGLAKPRSASPFGGMDKDIKKLIEQIRSGEVILPTDESTVRTPDGDFTCLTTLRLNNRGFFVDLALPAESALPPLIKWMKSWSEGVHSVSKEDFWSVIGQLPEHGPFTALDVMPPATYTEKLGGYWRASLRFDRLQLCPHALTPEERGKQKVEFDQWWEGVMTRLGRPGEATSSAEPHQSKVRMMAKIALVKSPFLNTGTETIETNPFLGERSRRTTDTCILESTLGKAAIVQDGDDLDVYLRFEHAESDNGCDDEQKFNSLLSGVGLAHCVNALPFYFERVQDTHTINRWLRPMFQASKPSLTPFWEGMCHGSSGCERLMNIAAEAFHKAGDSAAPLKHLLAVFHESDEPGIPFEVRLLTVCTLLEGLVAHLLGERLAAPAAFTNAKQQAIKWAEERSADVSCTDPDWNRLVEYLKGWGYTRPEEKWRRLCEVLGLPWNGCFDGIHAIWKEMRDPLSHGKHQEVSATNAGRQLMALSQLGGAFNVLAAAYLGYRGPIQVSPYENRVLTIGGVKL